MESCVYIRAFSREKQGLLVLMKADAMTPSYQYSASFKLLPYFYNVLSCILKLYGFNYHLNSCTVKCTSRHWLILNEYYFPLLCKTAEYSSQHNNELRSIITFRPKEFFSSIYALFRRSLLKCKTVMHFSLFQAQMPLLLQSEL